MEEGVHHGDLISLLASAAERHARLGGRRFQRVESRCAYRARIDDESHRHGAADVPGGILLRRRRGVRSVLERCRSARPASAGGNRRRAQERPCISHREHRTRLPMAGEHGLRHVGRRRHLIHRGRPDRRLHHEPVRIGHRRRRSILLDHRGEQVRPVGELGGERASPLIIGDAADRADHLPVLAHEQRYDVVLVIVLVLGDDRGGACQDGRRVTGRRWGRVDGRGREAAGSHHEVDARRAEVRRGNLRGPGVPAVGELLRARPGLIAPDGGRARVRTVLAVDRGHGHPAAGRGAASPGEKDLAGPDHFCRRRRAWGQYRKGGVAAIPVPLIGTATGEHQRKRNDRSCGGRQLQHTELLRAASNFQSIERRRLDGPLRIFCCGTTCAHKRVHCRM